MSSAEVIGPTVPRMARYRGALGRQIRSELRLVFGRRRNQAMLAFLAIVPIFIGVAVKISTPPRGEGPPFTSQLTSNGVFLTFTALTVCLPVFLPLASAVVAGDSIAGEANAGTLRGLLTVPVARGQLLAVKTVGVLAYVAAGVAIVALAGLLTGLVLFHPSGVTLLSGDTVSLSNGFLRALSIAAYVFIDLVGIAAIGVFFSTLTEVPIGAMAATIVTSVAFAVVDSVPQLGSLRTILLTHHWLDFGEILRSNPDVGALIGWGLLPLAYALIFLTAAWARVTTADVSG
jgi:ABC-2 type transport system permease protein